ncbi:hypothetical protein LINPERHAP2_LOCUS25262, partial [Linum perenne]
MSRIPGLVAIALVLLASLIFINVPNLTAAQVEKGSECLMENFEVQNCGPSNCDKVCKKDCMKSGKKDCYGVCAS